MAENEIYRKTDGVLFNYKSIKVEIENLSIEIEELKQDYRGCGAITYEEKSSPTYKFNSSVENELISREKQIKHLENIRNSKQRLIQKIDNSLKTLTDIERKIIELRCFEGYGWSKVGVLLNMDGDYCGRIKRDAINQIAPLIWIGTRYTE